MQSQPKASAARMLLLVAAVAAAACRQPPSTHAGPVDRDSTEVAPHPLVSTFGTGAVSTVTGAEIASRRAMRVDELLLGKPGVEVYRTGTSVSVRIRGAGTFVDPGEPLFLIDGQPVTFGADGVLMGLNPADIARIDVLKDAGSTAIYGVRGANGVIAITTKRAR